MWTNELKSRVTKLIERAAQAKDKDDLCGVLLDIEEDTGYKCEFIYDIFTELIIDEDVKPDQISSSTLYNIWDDVITPAYEFDY